MKKIILITLILFSLSILSKEIPKLSGPVVDEAGLLTNGERNNIAYALREYYTSTGNQLQLYITDTLDGGNIEEFSIKVVEEWKLGGEKDDKGVLFLIAIKDRRMRIEVGQGLEGHLTDIMAGRIIDSVVPFFKEDNFTGGIIFGLNAIALQAGGELKLHPPKTQTYKKSNRKRKSSLGLFVFIFILFLLLGRGSRGGAGWFLLGTALGSRGSGGGWSGGSGGGWSGGGGGFSGGGASGSW